MSLPLEIIGLNRPEITFIWEDEHETVYPARELRLRCRCALCVEEMSGRPLLDASKVPQDIVANRISVVGAYAINIKWSDGHETGIYHFRRLRDECPCKRCDLMRAAAAANPSPSHTDKSRGRS
jgi:ATP-binding protein involved in chromosome partitioning